MNDKRSLSDNKYKIITGISVTTSCILGYLLLKERGINVNLRSKQEILDSFGDSLETIKAAMSEGMVQEAIATTTRKLNRRNDELNTLISIPKLDFEQKIRLDKLTNEVNMFKNRLDAFNKLANEYTLND